MTPRLERFSHAIIIALAALLVAAVIALVVERRDSARPFEITSATPTASGPMMAYITGAVAQPGLYEIADGERVADLLNKAGGAAAEANLEALNLALLVHDQDQVTVPRVGEAATTGTLTSQVLGSNTDGAPVNINAASAADHRTLRAA